MEEAENLEEAKVELVMRTQGTGYLKVPSKVKEKIREKHGIEIKDLPEGNLKYKVTDGEIELLYKFEMEDEKDNSE